MEVLQAGVLVAATVATGLVAGVYALYAHTVMPALGRVDDRTFVTAFQALDRAVLNPWFLAGGFIGAPVLTVAAAVTQIGRPPLPWIVAALVLDVVAVVVTVRVNVPANDAIKAAGDPDRIDVAAVRAAFDEARWRRWNGLRVVVSIGAAALLAWALVLHGDPG